MGKRHLSNTGSFAVVAAVAVAVGIAGAGAGARSGRSAPVATWTQTSTPPPSREYAATTFIPLTCELLSYGGSQGGRIIFTSTLIYNPATDQWLELPARKGQVLGAVHMAQLSWDPLNATAALFGGSTPSASDRTFGFDPIGRTWRELVPRSQCQAGKCPPARNLHAQVWSRALGATLVFGGKNGSVKFGDLWALSAKRDRKGNVTWSWRQLASPDASSPEPRWGLGMAELGNGKILIYGGENAANEHLNDTWIYDPATNTYDRIATNAPTPRREFAIGYAPTLNAVVIQGGFINLMDQTDETWAFNEATLAWEPVTVNQSPGYRYGHHLASDTCSPGASAITFEQPAQYVASPPPPPPATWVLR